MTRPFPARLLALLAAALAASGCATGGDFPSLAPRAIEREDPRAEPVRTPPAVASDAALLAAVARLRADALAGAGAFAAELRAAEAAAGRAGAPGTEGWMEAQQALSRLEAARAPATIARAELDRLLILRASEPTAEEDLAAIRAALTEVERVAAEQQRHIDTLRSRISR